MGNKIDNMPINTQHGLWGKKSCSHPFHTAFKSTLCVSAAALIIASASACAGLPLTLVDKEVSDPDQTDNTENISQSYNLLGAFGLSYEVVGLDIHSSSPPAYVDFTNEGEIDLNYTAGGDIVGLFVTGIESIEDSTVTIDNQGAISSSATATGNNYFYSRQVGAKGIDTSGSVINSSTITTHAATEYNMYGSSAEATAIAAEGSVTNSGIINSSAESGDSYYGDSRADATGIFSSEEVSNTGDITATATSDYSYYGDSSADATGIDSSGNVSNTGNITTTATSYVSIHGDSSADATGIDSSGNVSNTGDITTTATSYVSIYGDSSADATGIDSSENVSNTGDITTTATSDYTRDGSSSADATGIFSSGDVSNTSDITAIATSYVSIFGGSSADATGIESSGDVSNSSNITATATSGFSIYGDSSADATGIFSSGDVSNTSNITTTATSDSSIFYDSSADATGIFSSEDVSNDSDITATATSDYSIFGGSSADATGIESSGNVSNDGNITTTATSDYSVFGDSYADATGIYSYYGSVTNSGAITVEAKSGQAGSESTADAYGIHASLGHDYTKAIENSGDLSVIASSINAEGSSAASAAGISTGYYDYISYTGTPCDNYSADPTVAGDISNSSGEIYVKAESAGKTDSNAEARGIYAFDGNIFNSNPATGEGTVTVTAISSDAEGTSSADAEGLMAWWDKVENEQIIDVTAESGDAETSQSRALGIYGWTGVTNKEGANITVAATSGEGESGSAAYAYGISANNGYTTNSASIEVYATSGNVTASDSEGEYVSLAHAEGICSAGDVNNSGSVYVKASSGTAYSSHAYANGINAKNTDYAGPIPPLPDPSYSVPGVVTNSSAITVISSTGDADSISQNARGISAYGTVTNDGAITVSATSGSAFYENSIQAIGIYSAAEVTNTGSITVNAGRGDSGYFSYDFSSDIDSLNGAAGIFAYNDITNSGDITVTASNGNLLTDSEMDGRNTAIAAGLVSVAGDITNSGDIVVDVTTGNGYDNGSRSAAFGIFGIYGNAITNEGTITVTAATSEDSETSSSGAIGIMLYNGGTVDSSGLINVEADYGYQIYNASSENVATITGFAMEFGATQEQLDARYEGCLGGYIAFSDDATLYVYAGDDMFEGINTYLIPALTEEDAASDVTRGYFADYEFKTASPDYDIEMSARSETELQELTIVFNPDVATPQYAASVRNFMFEQMNGIVKNSLFNPVLSHMLTGDPTQINYDGVLLASTTPIPDTSSVITQTPRKKSSVFVQPFYTNTSNSSAPMGYDADIYGLSGGYNYHVNGNAIVGVHAGYGNADIDYSGSGYDFRSEDIDTVSLGVHGIQRFAGNWLATATATFFYTDNDYRDQSSTNRETADYNTYGTDANIDLGYIFSFGNHFLVPEIGLSYLWQHNQSYTTENLDNADITYSSMDEHELYGRSGVSWYGNFQQKGWQIVPRVSVGVEQALTDGELSSTMSNGSSITTVKSDFGDTTLTTGASVEFSNTRYTFAAGYAGSYSSDLSDSSVYLQAVYRF